MKRKGERDLSLRFWLLKSVAWNSLPATSRALYLELAARYNGSNNGRISYSVREGAEALHVTKDTTARYLKILEDRGFIVCTKRGAFSHKTVRDASEWRLSEYDSDNPPAHATKEFMRWQPGKSDTNEAPKFKTRYDPSDRNCGKWSERYDPSDRKALKLSDHGTIRMTHIVTRYRVEASASVRKEKWFEAAYRDET